MVGRLGAYSHTHIMNNFYFPDNDHVSSFFFFFLNKNVMHMCVFPSLSFLKLKFIKNINMSAGGSGDGIARICTPHAYIG